MSERELTAIITYDISRPGVRRRVRRLLERHMARVQRSVFEARMTRRAAQRLFVRAEAMLEDGDGIRLYVLTAAGLEKSRASGGPPLPEAGNYWLL